MDNQSLWILIHAAWRAILPTYEPLFEHFAAERGLGARGLGWLLAALTFEPESITPARLQVRTPYTAAGLFLEELKAVAEGGYFLEAAPDEYLQTPKARAETLNLIEAGRAAMAEADPLPPADSQRIAEGLLGATALPHSGKIAGNAASAGYLVNLSELQIDAGA